MKYTTMDYGPGCARLQFQGIAYIIFAAIVLAFQTARAQPLRLTYLPEINSYSPDAGSPLLLNSYMLIPSGLMASTADPDTTIAQDTSAVQDTAAFPVETNVQLLPDKISFMEKFLWGENGFFRKVGLAKPLTPESRKSELGVRRTMLTAHMIGGITTLGLMIAASYFGQRIIDGHQNFRGTHQALVSAVIADYALTGLLAILSPPPLIRRDEESTISIHKTLAWVHFAGMVVTPILGNTIGGRRHFNVSRAHVHQISAYITTAVFASAMIVITF